MRKIFGKAEKRHFKNFVSIERLDNEFQNFYSKNIQNFIVQQEKKSNESQNFYSEYVQNFIVQQIKKSEKERKPILDALETRKNQEQQWQAWCSKQGINCKVEDLSKTLDDQPFRWRIFYFATHYWEARWLQDMEKCTSKKEKGQSDLKALWLRRAKLSPCFVSTLYMLPRFFCQDSKTSSYLYNFIDYLIFDESGQISTYVAAPNLALAKRAVIIGDAKQIEPICNIPEDIDIGNCIEFRVIAKEAEEEEYKAFTRKGLAAACNSLMDRAHYLCDFKQREDLDEAGFFLREHWRCVPEIVSYFNELAYKGYLEPERPSLPLKCRHYSVWGYAHIVEEPKTKEQKKCRRYPALGYAHIVGQPEKKGTSRCNRLEAYAIIDWLKRNAADIRKHYNNKPLHEIVAIITPFKPQGRLLSSLLKEAIQKSEKENQKSELDKDITIGTVHALQGAERPLIIFSPAYGASESLYFIDQKVNLLNVAVSRAQDSFLVFGNMNPFDSASPKPSGLLARKLFADEDNEIFDIEFFNINVRTHERLEPLKVDFINNLEGHQKVLRDSIQEATKRVLITSPFISINAIDNDKLATLINEADTRGIKVAIITDDYINKERETSTLKGREKLKEAGATVNTHPNIHDKVLCVDNHTIVIGSFNWLSASRAPEYAKAERSIFCKGGTQVYEEIDKCWKRLKKSKKA